MMESPGNEPRSALFARIRKSVSERGVDIRQNLNGNSLHLDFADGQRILVNFDAQTNNVWLAARSGGIEFIHRDGRWRAHDQRELFATLHELIERTILSNPVNARAPVQQDIQALRPGPVHLHETGKRNGLRNMLFILLAVVSGFWAAHRMEGPLSAPGMDPSGQKLSLNKLSYPCENTLPANGSVTLFPEGNLRADNPNDPEITLRNDHTHPLLLILSAPNTAIPLLSVLVHAGQGASLRLPPGVYDMMFSVGTAWCNPHSGFSQGHLLKLDKPLTVQTDKPMQLAMQSSGAGVEDFQLFVKTASPEISAPAPTFNGDGSMEVPRQANGHFYLPGTIDTIPVTFMVDTGASVTSISSDLARQAGIRNCKAVQFQTANGTANGCIALVPRMTLGSFTMENITVAVMDNLETNLLGANVLRNFQVSQNDSSMLIGRH